MEAKIVEGHPVVMWGRGRSVESGRGRRRIVENRKLILCWGDRPEVWCRIIDTENSVDVELGWEGVLFVVMCDRRTENGFLLVFEL